ncbi:NAD(P)/FAD-dependent oxidoreductase [Christiangramia salexigens]|uniref:FAD-dependent oxidoreductase n=1 Tax=Christiangramia salexigens TaxID=1913577 RepID=A0A1L3J366_9FLAO|nr:NAD(P)/FAD-dependent oxidoreductase [Christiangramia salexigens]APG59550.1 FAD-dependent oxidoreductase [Christiangramia salexigens]
MKETQVLIIGGGLAGLTTAIHLSQNNLRVILIERNEYPHHKVCGEYISMEVLPYLNSLNIDLTKLNGPEIHTFEYSTMAGEVIRASLEMGGLGLSRYRLDSFLFEQARGSCEILQDTVTESVFRNGSFITKCLSGTEYKSEFVLGAFGKRSNLDKFLNRNFFQSSSGWLGVKAHYRHKNFPDDLVALHNFEGGYCGLSKTETGNINACYLSNYKTFKKYKNTREFKEKVLFKNPHLKEFFLGADLLFEKEISIAQVSFDQKNRVEAHILMLGDAAGLIHPLCGNGMAIAIHSAKIVSENIIKYYGTKNYSRAMLEADYIYAWKIQFNSRMKNGRILQRILLNESLNSISQKLIKAMPDILPWIIKKTHGNYIC